MKNMYTRGQLALIGNVGRKAIRLYEEEGLITASRIDAGNGYHYYDEEQVARLNRVKQYKRLGLSLTDIKEILCNGTAEGEILSEKKQELDCKIRDMQELRKRMDQGAAAPKQVSQQSIDECTFPECFCLYIEENVELEKLGISVGKLCEQAARGQLTAAGAHFVKYEGLTEEDGAFQMTTCLPVYKSGTYENIPNTRTEQSVECVHMNFTGGFSRVGDAHMQMKQYMDQKGIAGNGTVYEVYNRDMSVDIYYARKL